MLEIATLVHPESSGMPVAVPQMDQLLGKRHYWPIYEAAQEHGLPVAFDQSAGLGAAPPVEVFVVVLTFFARRCLH